MASNPPENKSQQSAVLSIVSLLIFIHLCCVFAVLFANFRRSRLQADLVGAEAASAEAAELARAAGDARVLHAALGNLGLSRRD